MRWISIVLPALQIQKLSKKIHYFNCTTKHCKKEFSVWAVSSLESALPSASQHKRKGLALNLMILIYFNRIQQQ